MKSLIGMTFLAAFILTSGSAAAAQVSIGIHIGTPPPARVVYVVPPPPPEPEYMWVEGYWHPVGNHYKWHDGYWTRPPYAGARWIAPRYDRGLFFEGYWEGDRRRFERDRRWDRDHDRDYRDNDRGNGRGRGHQDRD